MRLRIDKYTDVNGFKVVRDDGRVGRKRPGRAICKSCGKEFECNIYSLKYNKGCGCHDKTPLPKLEKLINEFKVLEDLGRVNGNRRAKVICKVCEKVFECQVQNLKNANSCGCLKGKRIVCSYKQTHPRLFRIYRNMIKRCYDKNHKSYPNYGARNIFVCNEWSDCPDLFCEWALSKGYEEYLTLDRINGRDGYFAENCRWITVTEQNRNARTNVLDRETVKLIRNEDRSVMTVQAIADKYGLYRTTVSAVLNYHTWNNI